MAKAIEKTRNEGAIGASLEARAVIYADGELYNDIAALEDELRFVLLTSYAEVKPMAEKPSDLEPLEVEGLTFAVAVSALGDEYHKCERCWHHRDDVGKVEAHPTLCGRCVENLSPLGEERKYA